MGKVLRTIINNDLTTLADWDINGNICFLMPLKLFTCFLHLKK